MANNETIGSVGGGQLGLMNGEAARRLGFDYITLENDLHCPASVVSSEVLQGDIHDPKAVRRLAALSNVVTWEVDSISAQGLIDVGRRRAVHPNPSDLLTMQDKLTQKWFLRNHELPVGDFRAIEARYDFERTRELYGDMIIKVRQGGFDGRGNLDGAASWDATRAHFDAKFGKDSELYAEKRVNFERELSIVFARDIHGRVEPYPVVETIHARGICDTVIASPNRVGRRKNEQAGQIARHFASLMSGAGVYAIELFDLGDNLLINEIAMRVHNSGHWTDHGAETSQFEQHIRAITGMKLGSTAMRAPHAAMVNILGRDEKPEGAAITGADIALAKDRVPSAYIKLYGKTARFDRKEGHITTLGDDIGDVLQRAQLARSLIHV